MNLGDKKANVVGLWKANKYASDTSLAGCNWAAKNSKRSEAVFHIVKYL
jgi:hypothetical protein